MGKEDIVTSDYFEDNRFFADLVNGALFQGKQIVQPEHLQETSKELLYFKAGKGKRVIRDNVRRYFSGTLICIYVLEHQENIDYHMVIRNMLSEALEYDRQWYENQKRHREMCDLKTGHELISGMKKTDRFKPVVTLVVYYGEDKWDAASCLYDLLDFEKEDTSFFKKYIENYHIHVFDYHDYDNFDMFHTELWQVFSFLKYSSDKARLKKFIAEHQEEYYNVSEETCELIAVLTHSKELENVSDYKDEMTGGINMCKALEDIKREGIEEGMEKGIKALVLVSLNEGFTKSKILSNLQKYFVLTEEQAEQYFEQYALNA